MTAENPAPTPPTRSDLVRVVLPLVVALALVGGALAFVLLRGRFGRPPLPELGEIPAVTLVAESGRPFATTGLRGRVTIVDFFFTRCAGICPKLSATMERVQGRVVAGRLPVRLVSISVDPSHDTPTELAAYAERFHARPEIWTFLTGPTEAVQTAVVEGFKLPMGAPEPPKGATDSWNVLHSGKLVLVDATGKIRGYYESDEPGVERILADAAALAGGKTR